MLKSEDDTRQGHKLWAEDFSFTDPDHDRGVAFARWSPDSNFFVFSAISSGGHHRWQFYIYAFRPQNWQLYLLDLLYGEVVEQEFTIAAPNHLIRTVLNLTLYECLSSDSRKSNHSFLRIP